MVAATTDPEESMSSGDKLKKSLKQTRLPAFPPKYRPSKRHPELDRYQPKSRMPRRRALPLPAVSDSELLDKRETEPDSGTEPETDPGTEPPQTTEMTEQTTQLSQLLEFLAKQQAEQIRRDEQRLEEERHRREEEREREQQRREEERDREHRREEQMHRLMEKFSTSETRDDSSFKRPKPQLGKFQEGVDDVESYLSCFEGAATAAG